MHELKLLKDYVLLKEVEENPFRVRKTSSGIITSIETPWIQSQDSGDMEKLEQIIGFGVVTHVGPDCKAVKVGDGVYYDRRSIRGIPYGENPGWHINENNLVGYVSDHNGSVEKAIESEKEKAAAEVRKGNLHNPVSKHKSIEDLLN